MFPGFVVFGWIYFVVFTYFSFVSCLSLFLCVGGDTVSSVDIFMFSDFYLVSYSNFYDWIFMDILSLFCNFLSVTAFGGFSVAYFWFFCVCWFWCIFLLVLLLFFLLSHLSGFIMLSVSLGMVQLYFLALVCFYGSYFALFVDFLSVSALIVCLSGVFCLYFYCHLFFWLYCVSGGHLFLCFLLSLLLMMSVLFYVFWFLWVLCFWCYCWFWCFLGVIFCICFFKICQSLLCFMLSIFFCYCFDMFLDFGIFHGGYF